MDYSSLEKPRSFPAIGTQFACPVPDGSSYLLPSLGAVPGNGRVPGHHHHPHLPARSPLEVGRAVDWLASGAAGCDEEEEEEASTLPSTVDLRALQDSPVRSNSPVPVLSKRYVLRGRSRVILTVGD
jgi:hypothetical protein